MIYNFLSVYGIYYPSVTIETRVKYRIYHVYEEYKRRYTPLDGLPEAIAEGKQPSGV